MDRLEDSSNSILDSVIDSSNSILDNVLESSSNNSNSILDSVLESSSNNSNSILDSVLESSNSNSILDSILDSVIDSSNSNSILDSVIDSSNSNRIKKSYYVKKNTKSTGRPKIRTQEEIKIKRKELEKAYNIRRGQYINLINYYKTKHIIPLEILNLSIKSNIELINKYNIIHNYILDQKKKPITVL